jgi:hypothetical protein
MLLFVHMALIQEAFDSHEPSADPMRLKPVDLSPAEGPIHQAYRRHPFPLSPPARAKSSAQHGQDTNTPTDRDRLNLSHLTNDFEVHQEALWRTDLQDSTDV